ncbi:TIGR00270 family protein [Candidatus Woesearchaeota archaeon]|nr:TIGR00270 family protein [Candidatus Woesearchaeota archaeon]
MTVCELCGKATELFVAEIENVDLNVCSGCAKYGKIKRRLSHEPVYTRPKIVQEKPEFKIIDNFSQLLRQARERSDLTQEDFARFLQVKENVVSKWEQGSLRPDVETAERIGKILRINMVEKEEKISATTALEKKKGDELTLGDFVKVRKRH